MRWDLNPRTLRGKILSLVRFYGFIYLELQMRLNPNKIDRPLRYPCFYFLVLIASSHLFENKSIW